jgi:hypothetical protein
MKQHIEKQETERLFIATYIGITLFVFLSLTYSMVQINWPCLIIMNRVGGIDNVVVWERVIVRGVVMVHSCCVVANVLWYRVLGVS